MSRDLTLYQSMPVEGPVGADPDGTPLFRYYELVRMNFVKKYEGVTQSDLENYMIDTDIEIHFGMSKVSTSCPVSTIQPFLPIRIMGCFGSIL